MSKMPPPKGCTGTDGRWPSTADTTDWKLNQPEDCNIALRLPPNIIGLDIDQYGAKHGWDNLLRTRTQHQLTELPATWRTSARETPESGIYLYTIAPGTKLRGEAAPDVETIQHHHRFALVWPSTHPKGTPYRWRSPQGLTSTAVPHTIDIPPLPPDWHEYLTDTQPTPTPAQLPPPQTHRETTWDRQVTVEHAKARSALTTASPGSRHEIARDRSMALCRMEQNGLPGATTALDQLGALFVDAVHLERGSTTEAHAEWQRMVEGGRHLARTTLTATQIAHRDAQAATEALLPPDTPQDPLEPPEPPPWQVALIDWPEFWKHEQIERDFLINPLLVRGRGHALYASAKVGKSLLMLEAAAACATDTACMWTQPRGEPLTVVYFDMEMTEDDLRARILDLGYTDTDDLSHLHYYLLPSLPALDTAEGGSVVEQIVGDHHADIVVIDTMARVIEGEENNADTYRAFYRHTGTRLKRRKVTWSRLDHAGKDPTKGQRGSSAKADDVDIVWQMKTTNSGLQLRATHRRIPWVPEVITLRRDTTPLRHQIIGGDYPTGTADLARRLDDAGAPLWDLTRRQARALLTDTGHKATTELIVPAIQFRQQRAAGDIVPRTTDQAPDHKTDHVWND